MVNRIITDRKTAFAPATVANVGPGFDVLGFALADIGDRVHVEIDGNTSGVIMRSVSGDEGRLSMNPSENTASYAIMQVLETRGLQHQLQVKVDLEKGLPLGSGMGSSAASAVAAIVAIEGIFEDDLPFPVLLEIACECERVACGSPHADNVAPSLMGGIVLLPPLSKAPVSIPVPGQLWCAVIHPQMEIRTEDSRTILPDEISMDKAIATMGQLGGLISGFYESNYDRISQSLLDPLVTPYRSQLIPGFQKAMKAIGECGALGGGISGSGPSVFVLGKGKDGIEEAVVRIVEVFKEEGMASDTYVSAIASRGAYLLQQ